MFSFGQKAAAFMGTLQQLRHEYEANKRNLINSYLAKQNELNTQLEKVKQDIKTASKELEQKYKAKIQAGKRKHIDDTNRPEDVFAPRLGKRRRTKKVEEMDKRDETEKIPAGKSANSSQTRRSKRRKPLREADEKEEEEHDVPVPQPKRRKVVGMCDSRSSISQPQALDPRAPAVSSSCA
ncbi:hypothetical protein M9X92_010978 [Pyricularia oryzae]|nr:hypothetical protein M9X92_010978 [Pyricularia oryzae]